MQASTTRAVSARWRRPHRQEIIRLNIATATDMLAHFLPPMVKHGRGRVLNVASTSSFVPVPFMATYAASKAYLLSLTESLSEELLGSGVTMTALCPGVTATPMMDTISSGNPRFVKLIAPRCPTSRTSPTQATTPACTAR